MHDATGGFIKQGLSILCKQILLHKPLITTTFIWLFLQQCVKSTTVKFLLKQFSDCPVISYFPSTNPFSISLKCPLYLFCLQNEINFHSTIKQLVYNSITSPNNKQYGYNCKEVQNTVLRNLLLLEFTWLVLSQKLLMKLSVVTWATLHHFYKEIICWGAWQLWFALWNITFARIW